MPYTVTLKVGTPAALGTSSSTLETITAANIGILKEILLCNTDSVARTATIYLVPSGGSPAAANTILAARSLAAGELLAIGLSSLLAAGDTIRGLASAASVVSCRISRVECA